MRTETPQTRVMIVDDHPVYRDALARVVREHKAFALVAEAADGLQALRIARTTELDLVVLDVGLPGVPGMVVLSMLRAQHEQLPVVMLSGNSEPAVVHEALQRGASGYLDKSRGRPDICAVLRRASAGGLVVTDEVTAGQAVVACYRPPAAELSERELEVLALCAEGLLAPQIAERLVISVSTVRTHLARLYRKLEVPDRAAAVAKAARTGVLDLEGLATLRRGAHDPATAEGAPRAVRPPRRRADSLAR